MGSGKEKVVTRCKISVINTYKDKESRQMKARRVKFILLGSFNLKVASKSQKGLGVRRDCLTAGTIFNSSSPTPSPHHLTYIIDISSSLCSMLCKKFKAPNSLTYVQIKLPI